MPTTLSLHFPDKGQDGPIPGSIVHRAMISASLGALFDVTMTVHSTDPAIDPHTLIGERAELWLEGEPHVDRIPGVIRAVRQLSSFRAPDGKMASYYEVILGPSMFYTAHRSGRRIHQNKDAVTAVKDTLSAYGAVIDAPVVHLASSHPTREYTAQYEESDHDFVYRVLADEHLVSYFDPAKSSALVIVDDVASLTPTLPFRLPYHPPSGLEPSTPVALALRLEDAYAPGAVGLRDYDFEHPQMSRGNPVSLEGKAEMASGDSPYAKEQQLSHEGYEVGRFNDGGAGKAIAKKDLVALRGGARVIACETNLAMLPGTRFFVDDHPRSDTTGELLVVSARIQLDDGAPLPFGAGAASGSGSPRRSYSFRCVRVAAGYAPTRRRKPRAVGPESAFVVGSLDEGQIDVDEYGRVLVEFVWDRRDQRKGEPTRRVRVSQGWAGANRGFVTLPRIGDEVLIAYDGGDPDQPIVVGRVHNAVARTPLTLPEPDKTVSIWKSRTVGGDGFNQILMDDKPSDERLEIRAEKNRTDLTQEDESSTVGGDYSQDVSGTESIHVKGATTVNLDDTLDVVVEKDVHIRFKRNLRWQIDRAANCSAGSWDISGGSIHLHTKGTSITMSESDIEIKAAGNINIKASGQINIESGGTCNVKGSTINLN
ncbi:MAG: type VI secretion system tip protein TssI/VgrG [Polyangiaceae bacterium]